MDNNTLFFAFDGDLIGRRHASAILSDDVESISNISAEITSANEMIKDFVESHGGRMVSFGGDEGVFEAPESFIDYLEEIRKDYVYMVGATLSIGYGSKPSGAAKALLEAKETGKDKIVQYSENSEKYAQDVQEERDEEHGEGLDLSNNESKESDKVLPSGSDSNQNEPTLCEPSKEDNNHGYDSGYKNSEPETRVDSYEAQDLMPPVIRKPNLTTKPPIKEATSSDVQESTRLMNIEMPDPKDKDAMDKKPAPKEYHGQAEGNAPKSMAQPMDGKPSDIKYDDGKEADPDPTVPVENATTDQAEETEEEHMLGDKHCDSCTCGSNSTDVTDILDQHIDNANDLESHLESNTDNSTENVLNTHIDNANEMNDEMDSNGVSRPNDYDEKNEDMGLSEEEASDDEPNLANVLKDGLDSHADDIKKEKVLNLVGQALEAFKTQKPLLDKAKEQAPALHDACIMMLKAMIELCSLAGVNRQQAEEDVENIDTQNNPSENEDSTAANTKESCPTCGKEQEKNHAAPGETAEFPKE